MIAATWSEIFIAQIMIRIYAKNQRRANLVLHRTIRLVPSDGSSDWNEQQLVTKLIIATTRLH
jgi:hypothetical protein